MSLKKIDTKYIKELYELIEIINSDIDFDLSTSEILTNSLKERLSFEITEGSTIEMKTESIEKAEEEEIESFNTDDIVFDDKVILQSSILSLDEKVLCNEYVKLEKNEDVFEKFFRENISEHIQEKLDETVNEFKKETENRHLLDLLDSGDIKVENGVKIYYTLSSDLYNSDNYPAEIRDEVLEDISILDSDIVFNYKFEDNSFNSEMHVIRLKDSIWFIERPNVLIFH